MRRQSARENQGKSRPTHRAPRTAEEFFGKSERFQDIWNRAAHAVSRIRADGFSLARAAREYGLDPRTVIRWRGPALRKHANGRYVARASDRLLVVLLIPTKQGLREIGLRDSRQASQVAEYWDAVQKYLQRGDTSALRKFQDKHITDENRVDVPLLTDPDELDRLGSAGVLSFESLYARSA